ncbi:MAG: hypothetical protein GW886_04745 [Rhodobacterales bacterium]|nr:hypothetical protein [Rhodobacterales bacterium]NCT13056.1 hypothetical protein [Rhodobacterales bacterium]
MPDMTLTRTRLLAGQWEAVLSAPDGARPEIAVTHLGRALAGVEVTQTEEAGQWLLRVPVPLEAIADGVQTFVITDAATGAQLDSFTIIAGEALAEDLRAEIDLLRAELDMLKRAFRRHCVETAV